MADARPSSAADDAAEIKIESIRVRDVLPNPLIDDLKPHHLRRGVLIPLKTTQEVRQDHTITHAYITRAPTKSANEVLTFVIPVPSLCSLPVV